jgi:hypothetical protein
MLPFFGSCIIRTLHTGCANILMSSSGALRLNYSLIVILSDHIFLYFILLKQPFDKRKPLKTEKITETIVFRFRQVLLYV